MFRLHGDGSCSGLFCLGIVKPCANDLALARQNAPTIWLRPTRTCQRSGFALHDVPHTVRVYIIAAPTHCQLVSAKRRVSFPYVVELQSGEPQRRQQGSAKWGLCPWEMRGVCPNTHQVTSRACTGGPWGGGETGRGGGCVQAQRAAPSTWKGTPALSSAGQQTAPVASGVDTTQNRF